MLIMTHVRTRFNLCYVVNLLLVNYFTIYYNNYCSFLILSRGIPLVFFCRLPFVLVIRILK